MEVEKGEQRGRPKDGAEDVKIFQVVHRWFVRLNHEYLIQFEQCERRIKRKGWRRKNFFIHQIELNECYLRYVARKQELLNDTVQMQISAGVPFTAIAASPKVSEGILREQHLKI